MTRKEKKNLLHQELYIPPQLTFSLFSFCFFLTHLKVKQFNLLACENLTSIQVLFQLTL